MKRHLPLLKKITFTLVIILLAFFIWEYFTSPKFANFFIDLKKVLTQTNLKLFGLALVVYLSSIVMVALSWHSVLKMFEISVPVIPLIPIWMAGIFINNITPMSRAGGEIVRIYGLSKKFRLPYTISTLSVVLSKLIESIPVLLIGVIGSSVLVERQIVSWRQLIFIGLIVVLVTGIAVWGAYRKNYLPTLWSKLLSYLLHKEQKITNKQFIIEQSTIKEISWSIKHKKAFLASLLSASVFWAMGLARLKILASALDIEISVSALSAVKVWYILIGLLAFTPGGIGII